MRQRDAAFALGLPSVVAAVNSVKKKRSLSEDKWGKCKRRSASCPHQWKRRHSKGRHRKQNSPQHKYYERRRRRWIAMQYHAHVRILTVALHAFNKLLDIVRKKKNPFRGSTLFVSLSFHTKQQHVSICIHLPKRHMRSIFLQSFINFLRSS